MIRRVFAATAVVALLTGVACSSSSGGVCSSAWAGDYVLSMACGTPTDSADGLPCTACPGAMTMRISVSSPVDSGGIAGTTIGGAPVVTIMGDQGVSPFNPSVATCTTTMSCCGGGSSSCLLTSCVQNPDASDGRLVEIFRVEVDDQGDLVAPDGSVDANSLVEYSVDGVIYCAWSSLSGTQSQ
jgi:hypothetical protein